MAKHSSAILELARRGADMRYRELKSELSELTQSFPHLRTLGIGTPNGRRRRSNWRMSQAARKAASLRMKKYWANRRKKKTA